VALTGRRISVKLNCSFIGVLSKAMTLAHAHVGQRLTIERIGGERSFRRRLMELGLVPGTHVELVGVAPLGDPLELLVRGCSLSIRRGEALWVAVQRQDRYAAACNGETDGAPSPPCGTGCASCGAR
jgi:ferrous iron transport protein A